MESKAQGIETVPPHVIEFAARLWNVIQPKTLNPQLDEVHDFNQRERDRWVAKKASSLASGTKVLDIGAGTCPYRNLFSHCEYKTHDFKQYTGEKLGGTSEYGHIDYVSDIKSIPVPDASFDVLLCTEVFEHVPEPIEALREMSRIVKPGGRIFITAPLGSGLHQLPFHFYGGYTPHWYQHFGTEFGLEVSEITSNGGFFKLLSQEVARSAGYIASTLNLEREDSKVVNNFFGQILPLRLFELDETNMIEQFTVGYFVEMRKPAAGASLTDPAWQEISRQLAESSSNVETIINAALYWIEKKNFAEAREYAKKALTLDPHNQQLKKLLVELDRL
ncbi:MAG: methyltransferase domain-containing protein [Deltaproteobacteria bacterium]|nr:methyltransferase domain-containing protein [Deltaproteobacteria bacterium]